MRTAISQDVSHVILDRLVNQSTSWERFPFNVLHICNINFIKSHTVQDEENKILYAVVSRLTLFYRHTLKDCIWLGTIANKTKVWCHIPCWYSYLVIGRYDKMLIMKQIPDGNFNDKRRFDGIKYHLHSIKHSKQDSRERMHQSSLSYCADNTLQATFILKAF